MNSGAVGRRALLVFVLGVELALLAGVGSVAYLWPRADDDLGGPYYVKISSVPDPPPDPSPLPGASTGTYAWSCGRNEVGHRNSANVVVAPGIPGTAHHTHEYVGNLSTDANSTDTSLAAAPTSCTNGDKSTYFWPVLRTGEEGTGAPEFGRHGVIQDPSSVTLTFYGNPTSPVVAAPRFLRAVTGDAHAATNGGARARASWTCGRAPERRTTRYPICERGDQILRIFDFPSCWDGIRTDSPDHRSHVVFPDRLGACPRGRFPVPRLRLTLAYNLPPGVRFVIDAFENQRHNPLTDHALLVYVLPDELSAEVVGCLNAGRSCGLAS